MIRPPKAPISLAANFLNLHATIYEGDAPHRFHILWHESSKNYLNNENGLLTVESYISPAALFIFFAASAGTGVVPPDLLLPVDRAGLSLFEEEALSRLLIINIIPLR